MNNTLDTPTDTQSALAKRPSALRQIAKRYGGIVCALMALVVLFSVKSPNFLVANNLINIVLQVSIIAIVAFGMTYVLLLGEIDLSVGAIIAFVGGVAAQLQALNVMKSIDEIDMPGWNLHSLERDLKGHWSLKVNGNWRLTFTFDGEDVYIVNYQDYH